MNTLYFSPTLSEGSIYFLGTALCHTIAVLIYGYVAYRFFFWRFLALLFGVLCFEFLTSSLWVTAHLGKYSYLNGDVSIVMSLFWTSLIFSLRFFYDRLISEKSLLKEYTTIVIGTSILGLITIILLKAIGVFYYSPEMLQIVQSGILIFGRPLEALVYFPTFIIIVYSFYKYWELAMYNKLYFLDYSLKPGKDILLSTAVILLIGYLMHPLFSGASPFSYILLILGSIFSLAVTNLLLSFVTYFSLVIRFMLGTLIFSLFFSSIFSFLLEKGSLILSESLKINYTERTIMIPGFHFTDSEMVGIFFFSYLLIASVKYYKVISNNPPITILDENMTFRGWKSIFR